MEAESPAMAVGRGSVLASPARNAPSGSGGTSRKNKVTTWPGATPMGAAGAEWPAYASVAAGWAEIAGVGERHVRAKPLAQIAGAHGLEALAEGLGGGRVDGGERVELLRRLVESAGVGQKDGEQQVIGGVVAACVFDLRHGFHGGYLKAGLGRGRYRRTKGACADVRGDLPVIDAAAGERLFRSPFGG